VTGLTELNYIRKLLVSVGSRRAGTAQGQAQVMLRLGAEWVQVRYRICEYRLGTGLGAGLVQVIYRLGTGQVQVRYRLGTDQRTSLLILFSTDVQ
jgi:hypothetical protein